MKSFTLTANEGELEEQVKNYSTLKPYQSYRGISVMIISALILLGLLLSYILGDIDGYVFEDFLYGFIIFLPFLIFTYRGHRWAIIGLGILFILDKVMTLMMTLSIMPIVWMLIVLPYIWKAWQVESIRKSNNVSESRPHAVAENVIYCSKCGESHNSGASFCRNCGQEISH